MSSTSPRSAFGRFFHRRDASNATSDSQPATASSEAPRRSGSQSHRHDPPRRSLGDFVRSRSRSLSRPRTSHRRNISADIPPNPVVRQSGNVRYGDAGAPRRSGRDALPVDGAFLTLQATGPSVPPRDSSLKAPQLPEPPWNRNAVNINTHLVPAEDPYGERVADWNIEQNERPWSGGAHDLSAPLNVGRSDASFSDNSGSLQSRYPTPWNLAHKPDVENLRRSDDISRNKDITVPRKSSKRNSYPERRRVTRSSLDKSLPEVPLSNETNAPSVNDNGRDHGRPDRGVDSAPGRQREYLIKDSHEPIDLSRAVDLTNTEETHQYVKWAPAVTKETRIVNTHEVKQEVITRDIHNHDVFHRVLPIIDVEVLPPRHFVPVESGGYREISEAEIPSGTNSARLQQLIKEAVVKMVPENNQSGARQFTARKFEGTEGDYREYITPEGFKRTEQWWVHPPQLETGGQDSGQTQPFHFGSENPEDDGLRHPAREDSRPSVSRKPVPGRGEAPDGLGQHTSPVWQPATHTVLPIRMRHGEMAGGTRG